MACINLYKIDSNKIDMCYRDLQNSNFDLKDTKSFLKNINNKEYEITITLYLEKPKQSDNEEISWNWLLTEFEKPPLYAYKAPKAVLLIEETLDDAEEIYAVTFGSSFFKIDKYCDRDFGFRFAARVEYTNIKTTTLTAPNLKRNKIVNTYIDYNELDFSSGESFSKLKVNMKLNDNFNLFKPSVEIGNSIRFNTDKENLENIIDIILYVEDILSISDDDVNYKIPLFKIVKDEGLLKILNEKIYNILEKVY